MIMQYCTRLSGTMTNVKSHFFPQNTFMLLCIKIIMVPTLSDTKILPNSFQDLQNYVNTVSLALINLCHGYIFSHLKFLEST